jgi:hypothetical protein
LKPRKERKPNPKAVIASGEYDRRKANGIYQPGIAHIERLFGLRKGQLANYRANNISRRPQRPTTK